MWADDFQISQQRQALPLYAIFVDSPTMKILLQIVLLLVFFGCKKSKDFRSDFEKHKFDTTVINSLPLYDTLRQLVLNNYDSLYLNDEKNTFTYIYSFDTSIQISGQSNLDIPKKIYSQSVQIFKKIGKDNIFGFTITKDSTFEILIRNTHLTEYFLDVRERLYYHPNRKRIDKAHFPIKDTIIKDKWQYQIWYDKRTPI